MQKASCRPNLKEKLMGSLCHVLPPWTQTNSTAALIYVQNFILRTNTLFERREVEKLQKTLAYRNLSQAVGGTGEQKALLI